MCAADDGCVQGLEGSRDIDAEQETDAGAHADTQEEGHTEQQQLPEAPRPSVRTSMGPIANIPRTWQQSTHSSFKFCYPEAEKQLQPQDSNEGSSGLTYLRANSLGGSQHEQAAMAQ